MLYFVCVVVAFFRVCIVGDFVSASDKLCTVLQKQKDTKTKNQKKDKNGHNGQNKNKYMCNVSGSSRRCLCATMYPFGQDKYIAHYLDSQ